MHEPLLALIAVVCNVAAQLAAKHAGQTIQFGKDLSSWLSLWLFSAVALYGISFFLMVRVYAVNPLSVASPTMAGATFLLITLISSLFLGEGIGLQKLGGTFLIFLGILLLARS